MRGALLVTLVLAGCGDGSHDLTYHWDDQRLLCSVPIDDLAKSVDWKLIDDQLDLAAIDGSVVLLHAHKPGVTVSTDAIERALSDADARGLPTIAFRAFDDASPHQGALALAFDDNAPELWVTLHDQLAAHHARVTFFISRWARMTDEQHDQIRELASDGHDLQPHTVSHLNAVDYVAQHGLDAYMTDEVLPSYTPLEQLGYAPTTFAYPFGAHDAAIDARVLTTVSRVRGVYGGECP